MSHKHHDEYEIFAGKFSLRVRLLSAPCRTRWPSRTAVWQTGLSSNQKAVSPGPACSLVNRWGFDLAAANRMYEESEMSTPLPSVLKQMIHSAEGVDWNPYHGSNDKTQTGWKNRTHLISVFYKFVTEVLSQNEYNINIVKKKLNEMKNFWMKQYLALVTSILTIVITFNWGSTWNVQDNYCLKLPVAGLVSEPVCSYSIK